jgi:hypothetical protein
MTVKYLLASLLSLFGVFVTTNANFIFNLTTIAEIVSIDYKWDLHHKKQEYKSTGKFIPSNNAITGKIK